ncbi:MAG: cryptochrome/photolyase family protein [bacterium]
MSFAALIFPHQLFAEHPAQKGAKSTWLYESPHFFTRFKFHKQKLILHRASMKAYASKLQHKVHVRYADIKSFPTLALVLKDIRKHGYREVHIADVHDFALAEEITREIKKAKLKIVTHNSPAFLLSTRETASMLGGNPHVQMSAFYAKMRKKFGVLIDKKGEPVGGSWSFENENRKRLPKSAPIPELHYPNRCETAHEAFDYVEKNFRRHGGHTEGFMYPTTHTEAAAWLEDFLRHRLAEFGDYEDAIAEGEHALFHSLLSPLLNIGLLTPRQVLDATLHHARRHPIRLNSLEGFIRQILGSREFTRAIYANHGKELPEMNSLHNQRKLSKAFISGTTGIIPVDLTIKKVMETAYCHHTERLTVLGNFLLLTEVKPKLIHAWFMENFIDAAEWAVVPNVFAQSQYVDGGSITTKFHLTSSNYIRNISDYPSGEWEKIMDALFWRFLSRHDEILKAQPRLASLFEQMRKSPERLKKHIELADGFLKKL